MFVGCNVENASYGLSMCAERAAAFRMIADGAWRIVAVAIWTRLAEPGSPCGACRQVLAEFAGPGCEVVLAGTGETVVHTTLGALLPRPSPSTTSSAAPARADRRLPERSPHGAPPPSARGQAPRASAQFRPDPPP